MSTTTILVPGSRPKLGEDVVRQMLAKAGINTLTTVAILAIRGYYNDSMGRPGQNDVGMYDDAFFLVGTRPGQFQSANGNTDPSKLGWNPGVGKPYAMLQPGLWYFRRGPHKGKTPALRQCTDEEAEALHIPNEGHFKVLRAWGENDSRNYMEDDYFAINMHPGGQSTTSSWGCQTLPPDQAQDFLQTVWNWSLENNQKAIPYLLTLENPTA